MNKPKTALFMLGYIITFVLIGTFGENQFNLSFQKIFMITSALSLIIGYGIAQIEKSETQDNVSSTYPASKQKENDKK